MGWDGTMEWKRREEKGREGKQEQGWSIPPVIRMTLPERSGMSVSRLKATPPIVRC